MPVIDVRTDLDAATLTLTARFDAGVDAVWDLWADPRKLERWWGPPMYPATVTEHALVPGGKVAYYMTGPEGDQHGGWWRVVEVEPPTRLVFEDGFSQEDGSVNADLPVTRTVMTLESQDDGTLMTLLSCYPDVASLEQVLAMGMQEGITLAVNQMDTLLT
jgi:uncharacterized protein YndB with AHSA1/START domain